MKIDFNDCTTEDVIRRYPRITAHLIAESLGYFTPKSAALAIIRAKQGEPYFCEWYSHCATRYGDMWDRDNVSRVTKEMLSQAIRLRHSHVGSMGSYKHAKEIVDNAIDYENEPMLASWF